ncbi:protein FAM13B-like [Xenia sp. Carnegie-2017]|uniref:protein FAM13B-like n=1 Tax=Xenia sp. Carnegie-2017 TaxID=2897299 RepID=UPI001F041427|nr:protein FAM13B-like [Xenia sp. Carnegie-2017]
MKYLRSSNNSVEKLQKSEYSTSSTRGTLEEQMAKMKKIMWSPLSRRKHDGTTNPNITKTFGVPLDELIQRNYDDAEIPYVLERITEYITCYGMKQEGIFRVNGNSKIMEKLKAEFDKSGDADLENTGDVMSVAGLMKMFLRELPQPLIPKHFKKAFLQVHKEFYSEKDVCCSRMRNLVSELPNSRRKLLKFLCRFLVLVSLYEDTNKMNAKALSIVFSPNMFRCVDGLEGFREQAVTNCIVQMFIDEYDLIFKNDDEKSPSVRNLIQVEEADENSSMKSQTLPIAIQRHKSLKEKEPVSLEPSETIPHYAEYRFDDDNHIALVSPRSQYDDSHIYASVNKSQKESILSCSILDPSLDEVEPYIRSNSPSWHKPDNELFSAKLDSLPSSRKVYMERTIQESINEHLFGNNLTSTSEESDKWDSPCEEAPRVPIKIPELLSLDDVITKPQKRKKRRGSKSSQESAKTSIEVDSKQETLNVNKQKSYQENEVRISRSPKQRSKIYDIKNREPLTIKVAAAAAATDEERILKQENMDLAFLGSPLVLFCLTRDRAPPPQKRRPPSLIKRKIKRIDFKQSDPEIKTELKQLPRKPPSPPPRPNLSPSNSLSLAIVSKLERRKANRPAAEVANKSLVERDSELDSEGSSIPTDSPPGEGLHIRLNNDEHDPVVPPLDLYKIGQGVEDDPMISPRERYDSGALLFDDAMISPRSRRATLDIRGYFPENHSSHLDKQENLYADKTTSSKGDSSMKELGKRLKSLKKKIKDFEENFEKENGYKPTQAQDKVPIKKYLTELYRTQKLIQEMKEKRGQEKTSVDVTLENSSMVQVLGDEPLESLLTTLPVTVEQSLDKALKKLKDKRVMNGRPENINEMNRDQLQDEKLVVQKALLQHENSFGRPKTKRDKDIMKPLYDRYRSIKRKIANHNLKELSESISNQTTIEADKSKKMSPERPSNAEAVYVYEDDTVGSNSSDSMSRLVMSLPARTSKDFLDIDKDESPISPLTVCVDECENSGLETVLSEGVEEDCNDNSEQVITSKDPYAILHQASIVELLEQQASALKRKKRLRKKLKTFEDSFRKKTGRKVEKDDRGKHEEAYEEYKKIKARLRLLDALITKHQGNNTI